MLLVTAPGTDVLSDACPEHLISLGQRGLEHTVHHITPEGILAVAALRIVVPTEAVGRTYLKEQYHRHEHNDDHDERAVEFHDGSPPSCCWPACACPSLLPMRASSLSCSERISSASAASAS